MNILTGCASSAVAILFLACGRHRDQQVPASAPSTRTPSTVAATPSSRSLPDSAPMVAGPPLELEEGTFALTDSDGGQLVALDSLRRPAQIRNAVCSDAAVMPVSYLRYQAGQPDSATRQTAAYLAYLKGHVYRVSQGSAPPDATCYLSSDSTLVAAVVPAGRPSLGPCDSTLTRLIAAAKARPLVRCWFMGVAGPHSSVMTVQFANRDTSALASLVVADHGHLLFEDFPGTYRGPEQDVWRADDSGLFSPEGFQILFLARVRGVDIMAFTWAGSEGEDAYVVVADSASAFRTVSSSYRYWVPR